MDIPENLVAFYIPRYRGFWDMFDDAPTIFRVQKNLACSITGKPDIGVTEYPDVITSSKVRLNQTRRRKVVEKLARVKGNGILVVQTYHESK